MRSLTRKQMQDADRTMIEHYGVPGIVLMEHAALSMVPFCEDHALILCGAGNNGGDGFALARLLHLKNKHPRVIVYAKHELRGDAKTNRLAAEKLGVPVTDGYSDLSALRELIRTSKQIIDCLFGIGLNRPIEEPLKSVIQTVNEASLPVLSCDIPSGIDADTGETLGCAVRADRIITFHAMKKGLEHFDGVRVADIGISGE